MSASLQLPRHLEAAIWSHAQRELPSECVGVLGVGASGALRAIYPLANIAPHPERHYLADPLGVLRALRAMEKEDLKLGGIYHSHPCGLAQPSETDLTLAEYRVPYLIADVQRRVLRAYLLPENVQLKLELV